MNGGYVRGGYNTGCLFRETVFHDKHARCHTRANRHVVDGGPLGYPVDGVRGGFCHR